MPPSRGRLTAYRPRAISSHPNHTAGRQRLAQEEDRPHQEQHRPDPARQRVNHREVGAAVGQGDGDEVAGLEDRAEEHQPPPDGRDGRPLRMRMGEKRTAEPREHPPDEGRAVAAALESDVRDDVERRPRSAGGAGWRGSSAVRAAASEPQAARLRATPAPVGTRPVVPVEALDGRVQPGGGLKLGRQQARRRSGGVWSSSSGVKPALFSRVRISCTRAHGARLRVQAALFQPQPARVAVGDLRQEPGRLHALDGVQIVGEHPARPDLGDDVQRQIVLG